MGPGDSFVFSGNKLLPGPMLTQIYDNIYHGSEAKVCIDATKPGNSVLLSIKSALHFTKHETYEFLKFVITSQTENVIRG